MKKIIKNGLIAVSLSLLLAFTFFISINAKNNIKAAAQFENKVENGTLLEKDKTYYIDANEGINYLIDSGRSSISTGFSGNMNESASDLVAFRKMNVTSEQGIQAYTCTGANNTSCKLGYYPLEMNKVYYLLSTSSSMGRIKINNNAVNTLALGTEYVYIIDNKVYLTRDSAIQLDPITSQPIEIGDITNDYFTYKLDSEYEYNVYVRTSTSFPYYESFLYNDIVLPPPSSSDIITSTLNGISGLFTIYVPSFISAVVGTISGLFINNGSGTAVLGILVCICGIAIVTNIFRVALRMLKIKKKV